MLNGARLTRFAEVIFMFVSLGLKNAWQNKGRTALGIVSLAVAAVVLLSSTTLSRGYPAMAYFSARRLLGGDVVLLPGKYSLSQEDMAGGYTWRFERRSLDNPNLPMGLDTEPYSYGGMRGYPVSGSPDVSAGRYREVAELLLADPSVRSASIRRSLPFLVDAKDGYSYGFLDARNVSEDLETWHMGSYVRGKYIEEGGAITGVSVRGWRSLDLSNGMTGIEIPRYTESGLDYENSLNQGLLITGSVSFVDGEGATARTLATPAVFVSSSTMDAIAAEAGYPPEATYWGISVTLKDMSTSENVVASLRRQYPDFTVIPATQLSSVANGGTVAKGIPMDMRQVTEAIAFLTAALISAANLTVLMQSRKSEIGILRALGATRGNIVVMVLSESIVISLAGALLGAIVVQPAVIWQFVSNKVASDVVIGEVLGGLGKSAAFAVITAVLFGFLPVANALKITPAQVLRGE